VSLTADSPALQYNMGAGRAPGIVAAEAVADAAADEA